jgi:plasmid stability protein
MPPTALPLNFTVHGLDPEVAQALRDYASRTKKSLNASAKELLRTALGLPTPDEKARLAAWRSFLGSLPDEDADEMRETLKSFETIDEEMWK